MHGCPPPEKAWLLSLPLSLSERGLAVLRMVQRENATVDSRLAVCD